MEQQPGGLAHSPCEVCHRGVAGDDQIAVGDNGSGLQEIPGVIDLILATYKPILEGAGLQLLAAKSLLEREQGCVDLGGNGCKCL